MNSTQLTKNFIETREELEEIIQSLDPNSREIYDVLRKECIGMNPEDSDITIEVLYRHFPDIKKRSLIGRFGRLCRKGLLESRAEELTDGTLQKFIYLPEHSKGWLPPKLKPLGAKKEEPTSDLEPKAEPEESIEAQSPQIQFFPEGTPSTELDNFSKLLQHIDNQYLIFIFEEGECILVGGANSIDKVKGYLEQFPDHKHKVFNNISLQKKVVFDFVFEPIQ